MTRALVTGSAGRLGRSVVASLASGRSRGDRRRRHPGHPAEAAVTLPADLTNLGEAYDVMARFRPDAVIHLAAIATPFSRTDGLTFRTNTQLAFNICAAASSTGVGKRDRGQQPDRHRLRRARRLDAQLPAASTRSTPRAVERLQPVQARGRADDGRRSPRSSETTGSRRCARASWWRPRSGRARPPSRATPSPNGWTGRSIAGVSLFNYLDARDASDLIAAAPRTPARPAQRRGVLRRARPTRWPASPWPSCSPPSSPRPAAAASPHRHLPRLHLRQGRADAGLDRQAQLAHRTGDRMNLSGVLFFPVTPFDPDRELGRGGAGRAHQARASSTGPAAVFAACGTGEFPALSEAEHAAAVRVAVETDGRPGARCSRAPADRSARRSARPRGPRGGRRRPAAHAALPVQGTRGLRRPTYARSPRSCRSSSTSAARWCSTPEQVGRAGQDPGRDRAQGRPRGHRPDPADRAGGAREIGEDFRFFNGLPTAELTQAAYRGIGVELYSSRRLRLRAGDRHTRI